MAMTPTMPWKHFQFSRKVLQDWSKINCAKRGRENLPRIRSLHYPGREWKMRNNSCKLQLYVNFDRRFTCKVNQAREGVGTRKNGKKWNSDLYGVQPTRGAKYGGGDADSIVKGINFVFQDEKSLLKMDEESYKFKVRYVTHPPRKFITSF